MIKNLIDDQFKQFIDFLFDYNSISFDNSTSSSSHRFNSFFKLFIFLFVSLIIFFIFFVFFSVFFLFISAFLKRFFNCFFFSDCVETRERRAINMTSTTTHVSSMTSNSKMSEIVLFTSIDWLNQIIKSSAKDLRITKSMKSFSQTTYLINDV